MDFNLNYLSCGYDDYIRVRGKTKWVRGLKRIFSSMNLEHLPWVPVPQKIKGDIQKLGKILAKRQMGQIEGGKFAFFFVLFTLRFIICWQL